MSAELFKSMAGIDLLHVPYKWQRPGAAGPHDRTRRVLMFENMPGAVSYIQSGKLNVSAVTGLKRTPALPRREDCRRVRNSGLRVALLERHRRTVGNARGM